MKPSAMSGPPPSPPARSWRDHLRGREWGSLPVLIGLVLVWLFFQSQNPNYLTPRNLSNLVLQIGVVGSLGVGVVLVLLLGEIDLSLGAVSGVCAGVLGVLLAEHGWSGPAAALAAILVGAVIGALQGAIIVFVGVPSFIVTLAGFLAWQGVQLILLGERGELLIQDPFVRGLTSAYLPPAWSVMLAVLALLVFGLNLQRRRSARARDALGLEPASRDLLRFLVTAVAVAAAVLWFNAYFGVPDVLVLLLALVAVLGWVTGRTPFGRHMYAVGGNKEAARRASIPIASVQIAVFALASALAGVGGVLSASRQFAVSTGTGGGTLLLEAIAAAVIGGTSLFGGRGRVWQALLGALVIGSVANGLDLLGQPSSTKDIATGVILVIAVSFDALSRRQQPTR